MADTTDLTSDPVATASATAELQDMSPSDRLADLTAKATAQYALKHYNEAAELYSQATEIQAEQNGDMAIENADLLYAYGKCLFFLAQQTSSVLGNDAAQAQLSARKEKKPAKKRKIIGSRPNGEPSVSKVELKTDTAETTKVADVVPEADVKPETEADPDKPYFQIEGDTADWTSDEDEEEPEQQPEADEEEEEQDDFADSYEFLDIARVLYLKKLEQTEQSTLEASDKGKYIPSIDLDPAVKEIKTRIADIHDLQAEVQLEGEKYGAAVEDLQKYLALREELEPPESSLLAEGHFKLSLALEFKSQSQQRDQDGNPVGDIVVDWTIRNDAIVQQEKAIESCKLRIAKESAIMESLAEGEAKDKAMAEIEDVQDMVAEMDQRLSELRKPPVNVKEETQMKEQMAGILGSIMGASAEEQKESLAKAAAGAADISGLVRKKKGKVVGDGGGDSGFGSAASTPAPDTGGSSKVNGKRKVAFMEESEELGTGKKAKVEDAEDSGL